MSSCHNHGLDLESVIYKAITVLCPMYKYVLKDTYKGIFNLTVPWLAHNLLRSSFLEHFLVYLCTTSTQESNFVEKEI